MPNPLTIQRMAQMALDVQNASNLSGIVRSFAEVTTSMRLDHNMDSPTTNRHPVSIMFACKIADLTGAYAGTNVSYADAECRRLAQS